MADKKVTRATLAKYAGVLGRNSLAACALRFYDELRADAIPAEIRMHGTGFTIKTASGSFRYG